MTIRPIDFNGMIQRTDDVGALKKQEDSKSLIDQQNIQVQVAKNEANASHQVTDVNKNEQLQNQTDAKEEGRGNYQSFRGKKKKKEEPSGKVVKKTDAYSFDMKI